MNMNQLRRDALYRAAFELLPAIQLSEQIRNALAGAALHADRTSRQYRDSRQRARSTAPVATPNPRRISHY
jgi:hypothetical protein